MASKSNPKQKSATTLRGVINEVTKEKLKWLETQREVLKVHYAVILEDYEKPENKSSLKFIKRIHETLKTCPDDDNPAPQTTEDLSVLLNWIDTEDPDAEVYFGNRQLIKDWIEQLISYIRNQIEKCEYSCMYANAMTQYMDSNAAELSKLEDDEAAVLSGAGDTTSSEGKDKKETMDEFVTRVFSAAAPEGFDKNDFEKLLNEKLFNMEDHTEKKQLLGMRYTVKTHCQTFAEKNRIDIQNLKMTIAGLIHEDFLGRDKAATLKELRENEAALTEVCTLLNKRLRNYSTWTWPAPVVVNFKRNMAGRYRAYMDEDILTAILLHYIGAKWSIFFKHSFMRIYNSKIWKRGTGTSADLYYHYDSIEGFRRQFHERSFLSVLPNKMDDLAGALAIYDEEKKSRNRNENSDDQSPMKIKQQLLHIVSNEIHLNNALRQNKVPLTVVQTDMEWFGPSLIHEVVLSLMKYFGVTDEWLTFFKNFLEAPMRINSATAPVQTRKRGAPISHQLTTLFGESLLFVMDLYVNRESSLSIYRIHDDFWFWSHDTERVTQAWTAMQTFTKLAGLKLNEEKSASISCKGKTEGIVFGPEPLPQRNVQWGFIRLYSDGIFRITDDLLAPHVEEMKKYLDNADSVMNWIHGHNRYIRFFIRNFGQPALTFRKQHIVQILEKLRWILKQVHPHTTGDAVEALKLKYSDIFKGKEVMDSWVHWPVESGGLNLYNPFLDLIPLHEAYRRKDAREAAYGYVDPHFGYVFNSDKSTWTDLVEKSKERRKKRSQFIPHSKAELEEDTISDEEMYDDDQSENFKKGLNISKRDKRIGFEQYCERYRETKWENWRSHYCSLLENLDPISSSYCDDWKESLYTDQIESKLGHDETEFVDDNLVPLSLISAMQSERVHKN